MALANELISVRLDPARLKPADSEVRPTLRWREPDSNHRFRVTRLIPRQRKYAANESRHRDDAGRLSRDRWFESISLQRRVCKLSVPEKGYRSAA